MDLEILRARLGITQPWEKRAGDWWLEDAQLDVVSMARLMVESKTRLVTITAAALSKDECRLAFHWDVDGLLLTFATTTHAGSVESIAAICPAAEWIEREIHDYFDVHYSGRDDLAPLVLRSPDPPGLFRWNGHAGGSR